MSLWQKELLLSIFGSEECTEYLHPSSPINTTSLTYNIDHLLCFKDVFVLGSDLALFAGAEDMLTFRNHVLEREGLDDIGPPSAGRGSVVFLMREHPPTRMCHNFEDVLLWINQETGKDVVVIPDLTVLSFKEQVHLFAEADIVISPHGAGLTNAIFMRHGAAVVEMSGWGLSLPHYRNVAAVGGLYYFRYVADKERTFYDPHEPFRRAYNVKKSIRRCMDSICQEAARDYSFQVDEIGFRKLMREIASTVYDTEEDPVAGKIVNSVVE